MIRPRVQGTLSSKKTCRFSAPAKIQKSADKKMLSCRYEMKYRISESKAAAIEHHIQQYLPKDHYSKIQPGGDYPIVSLYLDSPDLKLCKETLSGKKNRFKLRIRSYSDEVGTPCFFEIKRRLNNIIIKSRARILSENISEVLSSLWLPDQKYKTDKEIVRQFQFYAQSINAKPITRVRYIRRAYEGASENRVRVTFDRQLSCNTSYLPSVSLNGGRWQRVELGRVILEIKFTSHYPAWLSRMVKTFNLQLQSTSKYTASIKNSALLGYDMPSVSEGIYG
jgi:SPX domain protein involved in polyphosphate accumulation